MQEKSEIIREQQPRQLDLADTRVEQRLQQLLIDTIVGGVLFNQLMPRIAWAVQDCTYDDMRFAEDGQGTTQGGG